MAGGANEGGEDAIVGINVTPLVDIVLVLLIIFMVTAKLIVSKSIPLELPKASTGTDQVQTVFSIVMTADNRTQVNSKDLASDDAIYPLAKAEREKNAELRAVIKADQAVSHGRVMHVLDLLKQAQVSKIAFGVQPSTGAPPGGAVPAPAPK